MNYKELNKEAWNKKTAVHVASEFYDNESFLAGKSSLNTFELELLGDLTGKKVLHLQCHFGQDTLSMARMGAEVTGVDLSDKSIEVARSMAKELNLNAKFICSDVLEFDQHLTEEYDIVYTSYGTVAWLPDTDRWASIISKALKKGGKFIFVEFHPFIWMYDDHQTHIKFKYSSHQPIEEEFQGTYADPDSPIDQKIVSWNHGLAKTTTSLLQSGLQLEVFREHDYSPYPCFENTYEFEKGKYRIEIFKEKVPYVFSQMFRKS